MGAKKSGFVPTMTNIVREAGALLLEHFNRQVTVEHKSESDPVTLADRESEALIVSQIRSRWPQHDVVGEEGSRVESGSEYCWFIDPLDGTANYAHGLPMFGISLAVQWKGERVAGVIYDPIRDELFAAEQGGGAYLNGNKIRVSSITKLNECLMATGVPIYKRHENPNIYFCHQMTLRTHGVRRSGSAALDLASIACGRLDGFWELNLKPWDTAAGVLIVEEAAGRVSNLRGGPFQLDGPETLATNGLLHEELLREFSAMFSGRGPEDLPKLLLENFGKKTR
jgi:myo-inositol-1(or 4)-monophosphatase